MRGILQRIQDALQPGRLLWRVRKLLPYVAITLSGMLIVFFLIDRVNKPMAFMANEFHKVITFVLALLSIGLSARVIALQRSQERKDYRRRLREYRQQAASQRERAERKR